MFREYFRQRNNSIQKTIDSKQNHYLSLYSYFETQVNWKKYFPEAVLLGPHERVSVWDNINYKLSQYDSGTPYEKSLAADDIKKVILNIANFKTYPEKEEFCIVQLDNITRKRIAFAMTGIDSIEITAWEGNHVWDIMNIKRKQLDMTEDQIFSQIIEKIRMIDAQRFQDKIRYQK